MYERLPSIYSLKDRRKVYQNHICFCSELISHSGQCDNRIEQHGNILILISSLISHLSPLTSHLSPLISHLSSLTSHLSPLTSHLSPLTSLSPLEYLSLRHAYIMPVLNDAQWLVPRTAAHQCLEVIEKNKMMVLGMNSFSVERGKRKVVAMDNHLGSGCCYQNSWYIFPPLLFLPLSSPSPFSSSPSSSSSLSFFPYFSYIYM